MHPDAGDTHNGSGISQSSLHAIFVEPENRHILGFSSVPDRLNGGPLMDCPRARITMVSGAVPYTMNPAIILLDPVNTIARVEMFFSLEATTTVVSCDAQSLSGLRSVSFADAQAPFESIPTAFVFTTIVTVVLTPFVNVPILQITVAIPAQLP
jgi:hypothetical protein